VIDHCAPDPRIGDFSSFDTLLREAAARGMKLLLFFEDREPVGPYLVQVPARRTRHVRFNDLDDPMQIPRETPFATLIHSSQPIICSTPAWIRGRRRTP
jgi:hypothetical protein